MLYVFLDLVLFCIISFGTYRVIKSIRKKREKKVVRPNMEVFHDPTLRQNTFKDYISVGLNNDADINGFGYAKYDDGNDLMRKMIREKKKDTEDNLAVKTVTSFENGGLNLNNGDSSYFNC